MKAVPSSLLFATLFSLPSAQSRFKGDGNIVYDIADIGAKGFGFSHLSANGQAQVLVFCCL
jgi:hypothetical protein